VSCKSIGYGDVVGILLHFPTSKPPLLHVEEQITEDPDSKRLLIEDREVFDHLSDSMWIEFYLNGKSMGRAFEGMMAHVTYFPAISVLIQLIHSS
jgi:hypothetical protein